MGWQYGRVRWPFDWGPPEVNDAGEDATSADAASAGDKAIPGARSLPHLGYLGGWSGGPFLVARPAALTTRDVGCRVAWGYSTVMTAVMLG